VLRGEGVTDRVVHPFYKLEKNAGRWQLAYEPKLIVKKTIEIETK
jgi:hypothetical protein